MPRVGLARAVECIEHRDLFDNYSSNFGSRRTFAGWGELPESIERPNPDDVTYWVYSYETPIGWIVEGKGAFVPAVWYDEVTARHQAVTLKAWRLPAFSWGEHTDDTKRDRP